MSSSSLSQRPTLIRLTRYDTPDADQFVLLHAAPTSAVHPLNLKLYATEGERAFATDSDLPTPVSALPHLRPLRLPIFQGGT